MNTTSRKNYRALGGGGVWATREIAALDFLTNVPLAAERSIVKAGLEGEEALLQEGGLATTMDQTSSGNSNKTDEEEEKCEIGHETRRSSDDWEPSKKQISTDHIGWWESLISTDKGFFEEQNARQRERDRLELESGLLELPTVTTESKKEGGDLESTQNTNMSALEEGLLPKNLPLEQSKPFFKPANHQNKPSFPPNNLYMPAPARRLEGLDAIDVRIPLEAEQTEHRTRHRTLARQVAIREWEREMTQKETNSILDGRLYCSAHCSYPLQVASIIKYEPKKEA